MPGAPRSPLDGTDRVVVDGTNLLYRIGGAAAPPAALVGRLRAAVPPAIAIELVFDGAGHGVSGRVAQAMRVRYAGRRPADDVILELVGDAASPGGAGPLGSARTLVVTDDRDLRTALTARGARTAGAAWLLGRMDVATPPPPRSRPSIGSGRPASGASASTGSAARDEREDARPAWKPGRGATARSGPAHKVARHRRHPRHPGWSP